MEKVKAEFDRNFKRWDICLPQEDILNRLRGQIIKNGWSIWYLFGDGEKGEYLDYYASHRMTDDSHDRIYFDGTRESLPTIMGMRMVSPDPEEDARWEEEHDAQNREIEKVLEQKGFGMTGDEPGGVAINRYLRLGK